MSAPSPRDRSIETVLDRIEDRLVDAPLGLHQVGPAADPAALEKSGLPPEIVALWGRWDGIDFAQGAARIFSLADQVQATRETQEAGLLQPGDRVMGDYGSFFLVLPADPWEAGGEVVMVEEDGERAPYASSALHLVLGIAAEMAVLYDEEGEFRDGLFAEDGQFTPRAERRLIRRRLDFDEDAPFPRFRLGQLLRRAGELSGARAELKRVLRCAPEFAWAHWELGRVNLGLAQDESLDPRARVESRARALESFGAAAKTGESYLEALFTAWRARAASEDEELRARLADRVKALDPGFVAARVTAVQEALEDEDGERARELLALGLAVEPRQIELLAMAKRVAALRALPNGDEDRDDQRAPSPKTKNKTRARARAKGRGRTGPSRPRKRKR